MGLRLFSLVRSSEVFFLSMGVTSVFFSGEKSVLVGGERLKM